MAKTDDKIREDVSVFDMLAEYGGWIVAVGLVVEVVLAFLYRGDKPFFEAWGPVIANTLVVVGVIAEVYFTRLSSHGQSELDRRSEERVAAANERAAAADARALEATLELAKFRAPRELTNEQWAHIREKVAPFTGTKFSGAVNRVDSEFMGFIAELMFCLIEAGWVGLDWHDPGSSTQSKFPSQLPKIGVGAALDDLVVTHPMGNMASASAARALTMALKAEGIAVVLAPSTGNDIAIIVGPKR
jgi:hypothetical protein